MNHNQTELLQQLRQGKVQPECAGNYWSKEEREELVRYYHEGVGISEMALLFNRGEMAIYQQMIGMNLPSNPETARVRGKKKKTQRCQDCGAELVCLACEEREEQAYA